MVEFLKALGKYDRTGDSIINWAPLSQAILILRSRHTHDPGQSITHGKEPIRIR